MSFATTACTNPATPTIATNPLVGPGNPLATSVCAPNLPSNPFPGIVSAISERNHQAGDAGVSQVSDICLPAPGAACGGTAFHFSSPATFTFLVDNTSLPPVCSGKNSDDAGTADVHAQHGGGGGGGCALRKITKVFHNNQLVSTSPTADPRVVSITFNSQKKITTVVVKSSENGSWDFG